MDNDKKVILEEELKKGWEAATQLRSLIPSQSSNHDDDQLNFNHETNMASMQNHSITILSSLETSLSIINDMVRSFHFQASSSKETSPKNRRCVIESPNLEPDGYTWRKYGQKGIQNTMYPREYFRCIYKEDQNCQATKHVQKISNSPTNYRITYYGDHTCQPNQTNNTNIAYYNVLNIPENDHFTNYMNFNSPNPLISTPKEAPKNHPTPSIISTTNNPPLPPSESLNPITTITATTITTTTTIDIVPSVDNATYIHQDPDVVLSPNMFISPNDYMGTLNIDYSYLADEPLDSINDLEDLNSFWDKI
ncbi:unnamed protein product [Amaranthus hypochondriacus]